MPKLTLVTIPRALVAKKQLDGSLSTIGSVIECAIKDGVDKREPDFFATLKGFEKVLRDLMAEDKEIQQMLLVESQLRKTQ